MAIADKLGGHLGWSWGNKKPVHPQPPPSVESSVITPSKFDKLWGHLGYKSGNVNPTQTTQSNKELIKLHK